MVSHVDGPTKFFLTLKNQKQFFEELEKDVDFFLSRRRLVSRFCSNFLKRMELGPCLALSATVKRFQRGLLISRGRRNMVFFVDIGIEEIVPWNSIWRNASPYQREGLWAKSDVGCCDGKHGVPR